jgi:hypothetical protein
MTHAALRLTVSSAEGEEPRTPIISSAPGAGHFSGVVGPSISTVMRPAPVGDERGIAVPNVWRDAGTFCAPGSWLWPLHQMLGIADSACDAPPGRESTALMFWSR